MTNEYTSPKTGNIISFLYDHAKSRLEKEELEWIGKASNFIVLDLENLSKTLDNVANLVMDDTVGGTFDTQDDKSSLLFSIVHQLDTLTACLAIAHEAQYRANNVGDCRKFDEAIARSASQTKKGKNPPSTT